MDNIEDRLIELETKASYQEDTVQQLNDVVSLQQARIDQLEAVIKELYQRIQDMSVGSVAGEGTAKSEKPPHY